MDKIFNVVDKDGNELTASLKEVIENNYTIVADSFSELKELVDNGVNFSVDLTGDGYVDDDNEVIYTGDGIYISMPEDPQEGEEGYDDKVIYEN